MSDMESGTLKLRIIGNFKEKSNNEYCYNWRYQKILSQKISIEISYEATISFHTFIIRFFSYLLSCIS